MDNIWKNINELSRQNSTLIGILQSRNRGHQNAVLADCDIAYGACAQRATDTFFERFTAQAFYKLLNVMGVVGEINTEVKRRSRCIISARTDEDREDQKHVER